MTHAEILAELAPGGVLRAGINMSNHLLVTGRGAAGEPEGVAPDMARAIAERLGVPLRLVPFASPKLVADAAGDDLWDICLIGNEPERAATIAFSGPYAQIEATYLVSAASGLRRIEEVDRAGVRIAANAGSAYGLWLGRHIRHARVIGEASSPAALARFREDGLEALAGLRTALAQDARGSPGARVLDGFFMTVQQSVGTARAHAAGAAFLRGFVAEAIASGLVAGLIARHGVVGLTVPAP